jgi:hypothetical protein
MKIKFEAIDTPILGTIYRLKNEKDEVLLIPTQDPKLAKFFAMNVCNFFNAELDVLLMEREDNGI